ncbi:MAG: nucleotide exchange factor GrpE [Clostridia bacterium]|nr:nucleotide exchange factor GrpE [Clostridia bacterium]
MFRKGKRNDKIDSEIKDNVNVDNNVNERKPDDANFNAVMEEISSLKDLFSRRLMEDKQKNELIEYLKERSEFAFVEPFLSDLILLLDRMEKTDDEFVKTLYEELLDILNRRGVSQIEVGKEFDPRYHNAVQIEEVDDDRISKMEIKRIVRNGYVLSNKVIRYAEVVVVKPKE